MCCTRTAGVTNDPYHSCHLQYLNKQTTALRDINDSRLSVYEQLEESVSDLEKTNRKLVEVAYADKAKIKR